MPIEFPQSNRHEFAQARSPIWRQRATRIDPNQSAKPTGWLCVENRALPITEIDLLEIIPGRGLHIRTRQESLLISLPEELQSDELLRAITSGEVNCLSGSCESYESLSESLKCSNSAPERDENSEAFRSLKNLGARVNVVVFPERISEAASKESTRVGKLAFTRPLARRLRHRPTSYPLTIIFGIWHMVPLMLSAKRVTPLPPVLPESICILVLCVFALVSAPTKLHSQCTGKSTDPPYKGGDQNPLTWFSLERLEQGEHKKAGA